MTNERIGGIQSDTADLAAAGKTYKLTGRGGNAIIISIEKPVVSVYKS